MFFMYSGTLSDKITDGLNRISSMFDAIPDLIVGVIYLILALVVAWLVKAIIVGVLRKIGLEKRLNKLGEKSGEGANKQPGTLALSIIGKLIFLLVFLLFLPAALGKFGMSGVTAPISDLVHTFVDYIPRVVACIVILTIGFFIANLVRQIVVALINATKVEKLQEKLSKGKYHLNIPKIVGTILYVVMVAVVLICALNVLNIEAISRPTSDLLASVVGAIPAILVAAIVLFVGIFLANMVSALLESFLASLHLDERINEWLNSTKKEEKAQIRKIPVVSILCGIVKTVIIVIFTVQAINTLNFEILTSVGAAVVGFLPAALVAVIVFLAAFFICRIIDTRANLNATIGKIVKAVIYAVAAFIALSQIGIAPAIVNTTFIVVVIALGVAFAIAAGVGGIPFVKNLLAQVKIGRCKKDAEKTDDKKED